MAKISKGYGLDHAYAFFKEKHGLDIDRATYRKICYDFNKSMVDEALTGRIVKIPHRLGELWVKKYQVDPEKPLLDMNESKKAGKPIYHLNFHSDGYIARWAWAKKNNLVTNLIYYSFKATRENSRALSKVMQEPDGHKKYFL